MNEREAIVHYTAPQLENKNKKCGGKENGRGRGERRKGGRTGEEKK